MVKRKGIYKQKGDYHKQLDKNWCCYHLHVEKTRILKNIIKQIPKNKKILDLGCGDGELVEYFAKKGWSIGGLDLNYASNYVKLGDALNTKFRARSFDVIVCTDLIEHLNLSDHEKLIHEIKRILKNNGSLILGAPNLAHLFSRLYFLFTGKLIRTAKINYHPGDRPLNEYITLLKKNNFKIKKTNTLPLGVPPMLQKKLPLKLTKLMYKLSKVLSIPSFSFDNILECKLK
jgi:2-polyprenyl-3-methyl-5-hydroxy-6-metoxy-1,4-benzoquinol methylase